MADLAGHTGCLFDVGDRRRGVVIKILAMLQRQPYRPLEMQAGAQPSLARGARLAASAAVWQLEQHRPGLGLEPTEAAAGHANGPQTSHGLQPARRAISRQASRVLSVLQNHGEPP
jgi:hypothetical protein